MSAVKSLSDFELQQLLACGDRDAYNELYTRYSIQVTRFLLKYLHTTALSEDTTQDVFIKIWHKREQLKEVQSFKAYLFTMSRNLALDSLKKAFRTTSAISEISASITAYRDAMEDERLSREYLLFIERILATLPARSREIFTLCREQGKTYNEAAKELGISRNAIKNHMVLTMMVLSTNAESELGISLTLLFALVFKR